MPNIVTNITINIIIVISFLKKLMLAILILAMRTELMVKFVMLETATVEQLLVP